MAVKPKQRIEPRLTAVVDQDNRTLGAPEIAQLQTEIAAPSSMSVRAPFAGHLAFGINPQRLGMLIRAADNGSTRDWFILCEEIEELFPHYSAVLAKRRRQVALLPITVEAAEDVPGAEEQADFVRKWLKTQVLQHAMFDITDAIGKGYSVNEIIWKTEPGCFWPEAIKWRNQRDFEVSWEDGETIWERVDAGYRPLVPHKFMLHAHKSKSGGAARSGITRMIAWMWMYATFTLKDWALFVQGYGLPVRLGRYGPEAGDNDKRTLWRAVRGIAGDLAAIIPKSMEMEFVQAGNVNDGSKLFSDRANWLNYEVSKMVLGGTAGTDAISGGHAVGQEHRAAEQDVEQFDAMLISGSVNQKIIPAMIAFTFGPQSGYPTIVIGTPEQVPLSDVIAAVADLGAFGFRVKADEIRDRLQLTKPEEGDEVLEPPPAPAAGDPNDPLASTDLKIKANPHPTINPSSDSRALMTGKLFGKLIALHTAAGEPLLDALEARLAHDAGAALGQMAGQVQACFAQAEDFDDLAKRLRKLDLDDTAFQTAIMQGLALANLAGQAELLDEITGHAKG